MSGGVETGWRPIKSAPTNGCGLLLYNGVKIVVGAYAQHKVRQPPWRESHAMGGVMHPQPTHWMPLPERPDRPSPTPAAKP